MIRQQNQRNNHPKKGTRLDIIPIRDENDIIAIKMILEAEEKYRDLLLFTVGINNGLRVSDLLQLKVHQLENLRVGECCHIIEQKTGKPNIVMMNNSISAALRKYLNSTDMKPDDYLFRNKRTNKPISVPMLNLLIKQWCKSIGLKGNYGSHSLRKTFGYIQRAKYGVSFEVLCERFQHSSPIITKKYLGIEKKEVQQILLNEI